MAGYVMTMDSLDSIANCIKKGFYSTILRNGNKVTRIWGLTKEGTFADYLSMRPGDHIYFFCNRFLYGRGELIDLDGESAFLCYQGADDPSVPVDGKESYRSCIPLIPGLKSTNRCMCLFKPAPFFLRQGVDMDEVLNSNPNAFRMLRTLWKLSFIKVDDEEDQALMDIIVKKNEGVLKDKAAIFPFDDSLHKQLENKELDSYRFSYHTILRLATDGGNLAWSRHEMAIEAALCNLLSHGGVQPFGKWDYISHQVAASPFKPVDYMDRMDIFGYRYISGFHTISKYLIIEIKKGEATISVVGQIMKYVDYVVQEYAHGDYSMIEAYIVAYGFPEEVKEACRKEAIRNYISGFRPTKSSVWKGLHLVEYRCDDGEIRFGEVSY